MKRRQFLLNLAALSPFYLSSLSLHASGQIHNISTNPSPRYRILHIVLRGNDMAATRALVNMASESGFNAIQFLLTNGVAMVKSPWTLRSNAWSKKQFLNWVDYVRTKGLEPIPEVSLLTHQEKFLGTTRPELMYNAMTYDPRKEEVYSVVFPFLDEIIDSIQPCAIHIGHDEVAGWNKSHARNKLKQGETPLPADLFIKDVSRLYTYLRDRSIDVWMWGDMLVAPDEFPDMLARHLHGVLPGYGKPIRNQLPRDIVICDWHYFDDQRDFPTLTRLQDEGFRVIAATWKKERTIRNFARYALANGAYGLMATTWHNIDSSRWSALINWIVRASGRIFADPQAVVPIISNTIDIDETD